MMRYITSILKQTTSATNHLCTASYTKKTWVHNNGENGYNNDIIENTLSKLQGGDVVLKTKPNGIAVLRIENIPKRNAFTGNMIIQLRKAVEQLQHWKCGKAIVVLGAEHMFCSGSDIAAIRAFSKPEDGQKLCMYMHNTLHMLAQVPQITVAMVEGKAFGGGAELMTACDFRLLEEGTITQFVQKKMGLVPGWGAVSRLLPLIGKQNTMKILFSAETISSKQAVKIGLADDTFFSHCVSTKGQSVLDSAFCEATPALKWLQENFDLENTESTVLQAMKQSITNTVGALSLNESYKSEIDAMGLVWGGRANRLALDRSRHGR